MDRLIREIVSDMRRSMFFKNDKVDLFGTFVNDPYGIIGVVP